MLVEINHLETKSFENAEAIRVEKVTAPSTLRERIIADRIVVAIMFIAVIIYSIINT